MRPTSFIVGTAALLAAAAVPLTALADTTPSPKAHGEWFAGAVTAASSSSVSVDVLWTGPKDGTLLGKNVAVAIDSATRIDYGKGQTSIDPGDLVRVHATSTLTARRIHVDCNCHFAAGTLGSVGNGTFAVNVERTGPYDTVLKGNAVTFHLGGATPSSALVTGEKVAVVFTATGFFKDPSFNWQTATFTATRVRVRAATSPTP